MYSAVTIVEVARPYLIIIAYRYGMKFFQNREEHRVRRKLDRLASEKVRPVSQSCMGFLLLPSKMDQYNKPCRHFMTAIVIRKSRGQEEKRPLSLNHLIEAIGSLRIELLLILR